MYCTVPGNYEEALPCITLIAPVVAAAAAAASDKCCSCKAATPSGPDVEALLRLLFMLAAGQKREYE